MKASHSSSGADRPSSSAGVTVRGPRRAARAVALVAVVALAVAACGGGSTPSDTAKSSSQQEGHPEDQLLGGLRLQAAAAGVQEAAPRTSRWSSTPATTTSSTRTSRSSWSPAPEHRTSPRSTRASSCSSSNQADKFVNVLDEKGGASYEPKYLPWKWKQSLSADGKTQIGLGTDVGGQAMCYRSDLFKAAGLPTDRDEVSALWPTWDDFVDRGPEVRQGLGWQEVRRRGDQHPQPGARPAAGRLLRRERDPQDGRRPEGRLGHVGQGHRRRSCRRTWRASRPRGTPRSRTASSPCLPAPRG